ncbi:hypothetical protein [Nonomuraea turcica]|uniref:hypothetical protein n=1 Tax=Nonomuraea sp. G32 TaxID=3067274 RepID=UPI00273A8F08|nr:hypothetical protein [Nonomuraea sp. G32]MDP4505085.1 hypothetical protein [Nonomuraea sp. G32]
MSDPGDLHMPARSQTFTSAHLPTPGTPESREDLYEVAVLAEHEDGTRGWAIVCSLPVRQVAEFMAKAHLMRVDIEVEAVQIRRRGVVVADYRPEHYFGEDSP